MKITSFIKGLPGLWTQQPLHTLERQAVTQWGARLSEKR
jgi:hypothetical protein